jgi:sarcosine oxidase/L-pipecolate oxidase
VSNKDKEARTDQRIQFRASYGKEIHYQRLAFESRKAWVAEDEKRGFSERSNESDDQRIFVNSGMLRIQPLDHLATLEKETLANMQRDGLRDTQFVKSDPADCQRADKLGWKEKILDFQIPDSPGKTYEAVLDSTAGFVRCSNACVHYQRMAADKGVKFYFGPEGAVDSLIKVISSLEPGKGKVTGLRTTNGIVHDADVVVIAGKSPNTSLFYYANFHVAGSFSTQILPELSYHLESSAGSLATFKIDRGNTALWEKYSPERFPVMTWKSVARDSSGKDTGSIYVLPRTPEGFVKIGYRGIKVIKDPSSSFDFADHISSGLISNPHRKTLHLPKTGNGRFLFR